MSQTWETKESFLTDPNLITVAEGIYLYKQFISPEQTAAVTAAIEATIEDRIKNDKQMDWSKHKMSPSVFELFDVWEKMSQFLYPTHLIHPRLEVSIIKPGDSGMAVHADSPGEGNHDVLTQEDVWGTCTILDYGVVAYFGDYTGGAIYYPEQGIEFIPEPGDLVIHIALPSHKHGVKPVDSGVRYAFSNFSLPSTKNPGSFYTFNSLEYNQVRYTAEDYPFALGKKLKENKREYKNLLDVYHNYK